METIIVDLKDNDKFQENGFDAKITMLLEENSSEYGFSASYSIPVEQ